MLLHLNTLGRDRRRIGSQRVENRCTESPPRTYTGSYRAFATVIKFASSSNPLPIPKPNVSHNHPTQRR